MRKNFFPRLLAAALLNACAIQDGYSQANVSLSNLASPTAINADLLPDTNDSKDLGSSLYGWRSLYLNNSIYMRAQKFLSGDLDNNTLVGIEVGTLLAGGSDNTAMGHRALFSAVRATQNIAIGRSALYSSEYGAFNIGIGISALAKNLDAMENLAIGTYAGYWNTTSEGNTTIGHYAMQHNTAEQNTAVGYQTMTYNTSGQANAALGALSLRENTTGSNNSAFGYRALQLNKVSGENTATGAYALFSSSGIGNTAVGYNSLGSTTTGQDMTAVGEWSGYSSWTGWGNSFFGSYASVMPTNSWNATALGYEAYATASDQVRIGNTYVSSIGGYTGWTNLSDGRFKKDLKENVPGLEFITRLRPVTYTLDMDGLDAALKPTQRGNPAAGKGGAPTLSERKNNPEIKAAKLRKAAIIQTGFVAQEVEKAAQELGYNFSGVDAPKNSHDFYGLRYAEFVVPLVKAVQELNEKNEALEERVKRLEELIERSAGNNNASVLLSGAKLEQNAPNPFNGNTMIGYTIPENEMAGRIVITDMKGAVVKAINVSGRGQLTVSRGSLASGEYVYSLWIGERKVDSKKMLVK